MKVSLLHKDPNFAILAQNLCLRDEVTDFVSTIIEPIDGYLDFVIHSDGNNFSTDEWGI